MRAESVRVLLKYKADVEARNRDGCTPIEIPAYFGQSICVKVFLENGVKADSGKKGKSSLLIAAAKRHKDVARDLLAHRADVEFLADSHNR